jgi:ACR3 family arsenite efflux pump ArsB
MVILYIITYVIIGLVVACTVRDLCDHIDNISMDEEQFISFIVFWPIGLFIFIFILLVKFCEWVFRNDR